MSALTQVVISQAESASPLIPQQEGQSPEVVPVIERKPSNQLTPPEQFTRLLQRYYATVQQTSRLGADAQSFIDADYAILFDFASQHQFQSQMPVKHIANAEGRVHRRQEGQDGADSSLA